MINWSKRIENVSNVAVTIVCLAMLVVLVTRFYSPQRQEKGNALTPPPVGTKLAVKNLDWTQRDRTLILAVSTQCHFCTASAGFYQRLSTQAKLKNVRIVAVFPQPESEAKTYFQGLNVPVTEIYRAPLSEVSVSGTPTIIMVDRSGVITKAWVGQLTPPKENEVLSQL